MIEVNVPGTKGYAENAPALIAQWQGISFAEHHVLVADLTGCLIDDSGSACISRKCGIG
ncbi:hypothetical protein WN982_33805 [Paraburkholderia sp. IMGN_8]|uniref:hypothetical protein n=1 Tax=Paraburkholderia sp. IMGN_8 TaxID=3136564 RepID=UPI003101676F